MVVSSAAYHCSRERTEPQDVPQRLGNGGEENGTIEYLVGPGKDRTEALSLETSLQRMIVGQQEAIQQIVNIYQMHLTGMSAPSRPIELLVPGTYGLRQDSHR